MSSDIDPDRLLDEPSYFVEEYVGVEPFDYQTEFMDHDSTRKVAVCGRRVGKSRMAGWMALHAAVTNSNHEIIVTAKARRQASELFNQIKKEVRKSAYSEEAWGISDSTNTEINFTNGSRIKVLPVGRDGSNIRGYGADMLTVDEAAFIKDDIFQQVLSPMLAVGDSTFVLLSTPFGKDGYLYNRYQDAMEDDSSEWFGINVPTSANPLIDESFIKEQERTLTRNQFKREILGKFSSTSDAFFTHEELTNNNVAKNQPVHQESDVCYLGVDLASTGGDLSVYVCIDEDGNVFNIDYTEDKPLTEAMGKVTELDNTYDFTKILIDSTGLGQGVVDQLKETLGRKVQGFKFSNESKQSLYNTLKNELQKGAISYYFISDKDEPENRMVKQCLDLKKSFTSTGKLKISHPSNGHDDFSDALSLAVWAKTQKSMARSDRGSMKPFNLGSL
jgi:phage terminase large subunit-like protein